MTKEDMKNKYSTFITEVSEILGLGKPVDILKLCATTDLFFQPLEKRIEELEKENADQKEANIELQRLVQQREQRGLEVQEDLLKENAELKHQLNKNPCVRIPEWHCSDCLERLTKAKEILQTVLDKWKEERWILQSDEEVKQIENLMEQTENFLKECK